MAEWKQTLNHVSTMPVVQWRFIYRNRSNNYIDSPSSRKFMQ